MFNFNESKQRIIDVLSDKTKIEEKEYVPSSDSTLTYENGIKSWVCAIFIDIRDSSSYFEKNPDIVARVMRAFIQELIALIKDNDSKLHILREIGIRGDCVYAIYTAPLKEHINNVLNVATHIISLNNMFQRILYKNHFPTFDIGIGIGANEDVVVKVGKAYTDVNDKIWIGKAVVDASNLSCYGNSKTTNCKTIVISQCVFANLNDNDKILFQKSNINGETIYHGDFYFSEERDWVEKNV